MAWIAAIVDIVFGLLFLFGAISGRLVPRDKFLGILAAAFGAFLICIGMRVIAKLSRPR